MPAHHMSEQESCVKLCRVPHYLVDYLFVDKIANVARVCPTLYGELQVRQNLQHGGTKGGGTMKMKANARRSIRS